jgi:hypothetical protein
MSVFVLFCWFATVPPPGQHGQMTGIYKRETLCLQSARNLKRAAESEREPLYCECRTDTVQESPSK